MGQKIKTFKTQVAVGTGGQLAEIYLGAYIPDNVDFSKPYDLVIYFHGVKGTVGGIVGNETLQAAIDKAPNAILVGVGKAKNPGKTYPKKFNPGIQLAGVILNSLWYDTGGKIKNHPSLAKGGHEAWKSNMSQDAHAYAFSGGGGALANLLVNFAKAELTTGFKHIQFNDGIYTWSTKAEKGIQNALGGYGKTTVTLRYGAYANSTNKLTAEKIKKNLQKKKAKNVGNLTISKFAGSHMDALGLLDTSKFLTVADIISPEDVPPPKPAAPAPAPDPKPKPEPKEEPTPAGTTGGSNIYPQVIRLPINQRGITIKRFESEVIENFKYFNKFVFFGEEVELKAYAAKVQKAGSKKDAGTATEAILWFGEFTMPAGATDAQIEKKAADVAGKMVVDAKMISPAYQEHFRFSNHVFKNSSAKNRYRFWAFSTISQFIIFGNSKVTFKNDAQTYTQVPVQNPSSANFSRSNSSGNYVTQMRYVDLEHYCSVAQKVLRNLDERIKFYDIKFDVPIDLVYYAGLLNGVPSQILDILTANNQSAENAMLWLEFDPEYKQLLNLSIIPPKVLKSRHDSDDYTRLEVPSGTFTHQRLNSLIWNLPVIYNKYTVGSWGFRLKQGGRGIFTSADQIRVFLNQFFFPSPSIVTSDVSRKILEKFILGDARLLDEKFYKEYIVSRKDMPVAFRENMNNQVSRQYEAIGDMLGDKFVRGEFRQITSVEDLYDQVVDWIPIPRLIQMATLCLLKLIPLDKLLDAICRPVLERWDDHKEAIIQSLEGMDNGIAKDLAQELKQMYFELVEDKYAEEVGGSITQYVKSLPQALQDSFDEGNWGSMASINTMISTLFQNVKMLLKVYGVGESSLQSRLMSVNLRIKTLGDELFTLQQKLKIFGGNIPPTKQQSLAYYNKQIGDLSVIRERLIKGIGNITDQLRIYNFIIPIGFYDYYIKQAKKEKFSQLVAIIKADEDSNPLFPALLAVNPYVTENEKNKILQDSLNGWAGTVVPTPPEAIKVLNGFKNRFDTIKTSFFTTIVMSTDGEEFAFSFPSGYGGFTTTAKSPIFDLNLSAVMMIFRTLRDLNSDDSAMGPSAAIASVSNFTYDTMDDYLGAVFNDPTKRYHLCLAIYAAVPAVAMLIKQLIEDPSAITAIFDGFIRRIKMFARMDYPIQDILSELAASLMQIGYNLARDLIITGMMQAIYAITDACADADKVNVPYSPLGAVDLSGFMMDSTVGSNTSPTEELDNTSSYKAIIEIQPDITVTQFKTILSQVSKAFTINEMCSMLDGRSKSELYVRAQSIFNSLEFLQDTNFLKIYGTTEGIRQFFILITQDINPNFCAQAIANFEKEKSMLLEMCFGTDDTTLREMFCKGKTDKECLDLLSIRASLPTDLLGDLVNKLDGLFKTFEVPDPCADGEGIWDPSQNYTAEKIGQSIFGALEKSLEADVEKVKDIYGGAFAVFGNKKLFAKTSNSMLSSIVAQSNKGNDKDAAVVKELKKKIKDSSQSSDMVALKLLNEVSRIFDEFQQSSVHHPESSDKAWLFTTPFHRVGIPFEAPEGEGSKPIAFHETIDIENAEGFSPQRRIDFEFNTENSLNTSLSSRVEELSPDGDVVQSAILTHYQTNKFQELMDKNTGDKHLYTPDNVLFLSNPNESDSQPTGICTIQPEYDKLVRQRITSFALRPENDFYLSLLNNIYRDLFVTSFKNGIFLKKNFDKLMLNEKIDYKDCHLGFLNMNILTKHLQLLSRKLACYGSDSPTLSPINVAIIKMALDVLVRVVAVKELMKSLFVYGLFPSELIKDGTVSVYDQFISAEIEKAVEKRVSKDKTEWSKFYSEVIKGFIVDIVKVLNQDDNITPEMAYQQIKIPQVNFAKNTLKSGFKNVTGSLYGDSIKPSTEYQVLQDVLSLPEGTELPAEAKYLVLENLSMADQLQALQNDVLTLYIGAGMTQRSRTYVTYGPPSEEYPTSIPQINRSSDHVSLNYYDYKTLQPTSSANMKTILQGINSGPVLERMIEFKPLASAFTPEEKTKLILFFTALGDPAIIADTGQGHPALGNTPARIFLRNFFYETKLIMLVPQLRIIIDSLVHPLNTSGAHYQEFIEFKPVKVKALDEEGNEIEVDSFEPVGFDLFAKFFKFNFAPDDFPEIVTEIMTDEKYRFPSGAGWGSDLSWELSGKVYLPDLERLIIGDYFYDADPYAAGGFREPYYEEKPVPKDNQEYPLSDYYENFDQQKDNVYNRYGPKMTVKASKTSLRWLYGIFENVQGESITFKSHKAAFEMMFKEEWSGFSNFFLWLFETPVSNIINISTVMRLTAYVDLGWGSLSNNEAPAEQKVKEFEAAVYGPPNMFVGQVPPLAFAKTNLSLLNEKIGITKFIYTYPDDNKDKIGDDPITGHSSKYITFPLFEGKKEIPPKITWYEFFGAVDKRSYLSEHFYANLFNSVPPAEWDPNNVFFKTTGVTNPSFILNYISAFKTIASFGTQKKEPVYIEKYQSNIWFNIRGSIVSQNDILHHWENAGADKLSNGNENFANNEQLGNDPFVYLTDASKASLSEDSGFFLNDNEDGLTEIPNRLLSAGSHATYDDGYSMGTHLNSKNNPHPKAENHNYDQYISMHQEALYDGAGGLQDMSIGLGEKVSINLPCVGNSIYCKVGEWDIVNSEGTVIVPNAPKFIAIRNAYHTGDPTHDPQWIDYGWVWHTDDTDLGEAAVSLSREFPGTWFDVRGEWNIGGFYDPNNTPKASKVGDQDPGPWLDPPWYGPNQYDYWKTGDTATPANWSPGFIVGGLTSVKRIKVPLDIHSQAKEYLNAYQLFLKCLDDGDREMFKVFLKSFFIKEQTTIIAMLHKLYAEKFYPELETNFDATIDLALETLFTAVATAKGDYQYEPNADFPLDMQMISGMLLKMFFGAMANTVDPTWKTPWFMPGPFTPFGVVAKYLDENGDMFNSDPTKATKPRGLKALPSACADVEEDQYKFFLDATTDSKSSQEESEDS